MATHSCIACVTAPITIACSVSVSQLYMVCNLCSVRSAGQMLLRQLKRCRGTILNSLKECNSKQHSLPQAVRNNSKDPMIAVVVMDVQNMTRND